MPDIRELIKQYNSETSLFKKIDLLRDLSDLGGSEALAALQSAIGDPDRMLRENAAKILGEIGSSQSNAILIQALGHEDDHFRKKAIEALGAAGATEAIEPLERLTQSDSWSLKYAAKRALEAIEAKKSNPVSSAPKPVATSDSARSDYETLIKSAIQNLGGKLEIDPKGHQHRLTLPFASGRKQTVYIITGGHDSEGSSLILIYTICAPATPENHERALIYNMRMSYGALAIKEINGKNMFVIVDALPAASAESSSLRKSICSVARHGDKVELNLTEKDVH